MNKWISRSQEMSLKKHDQVDGDGSIKVGGKAPELTCDTSGLYALRQAFHQRALAFDLAQVATFSAMDAWTNVLFERTPRKGTLRST